MPVTKCTIDNQDGYKWGDQGKCYVGPDAKQKAIAQGIAIGEGDKLEKLQRISELARIRVSFDYDDTVTLTKVQNIVKRLITAGATEVYIISARDNAASMYALANKLGIPMYRVFAEGSNEGKIEKIKELNIRTHYDNNPDVIREIPSIGKLI
jgi:hypothetical protein